MLQHVCILPDSLTITGKKKERKERKKKELTDLCLDRSIPQNLTFGYQGLPLGIGNDATVNGSANGQGNSSDSGSGSAASATAAANTGLTFFAFMGLMFWQFL